MSIERRTGGAARGGRQWLFLIVPLILLALGAVLVIGRSQRPISIHVDGQDIHLRPRHSATVAQVLNEASIRVGPLDRISPSPSSSLSPSLVVTVVRVANQDETRRVPIPYDRIVSTDARLVNGSRQIAQAGLAGVKEISEVVTTEDGVESARRVTAEQIILQPRSELVVVGTRADATLDGFRDNALSYLGRGGVTRLSPSVVEQTLFELARRRGDRYGSVRVLATGGRPWLVLQSFARTAEDVSLLVFWWADELHAYGQVLNQGLYMLDARAVKTEGATEIGLVVSPGQSTETLAPQFVLLRLPTGADTGDTWQLLWSSQGLPEWRSAQGSVAFTGDGLERLDVKGAASVEDDSAGIAGPRRRFESTWQRQGDTYAAQSQALVASPYGALWSFMSAARAGAITQTMPLVAGTSVISSALKAGLDRPDRQWSTSGRETDTAFELRSKDTTLRVTLDQRDGAWIITGVSSLGGQGRILFTATRPVVHGLLSADPAASSPQQSLGEGQRYVWSPDYARIAFDWQGQVYVINGDGSGLRAEGKGSAPAWSGDARRLAYERPSDRGPLIIVADLESGRETTLVSGRRPVWAPAEGAAGQKLAYAYSATPTDPAAVYIIDATSGASSVVASDGSDPVWSPDGSSIAFLTSRAEVAVVTLDPPAVSIVARGWGYTWSPDSQRLAFVSAAPAGRPLVWDRTTRTVSDLLQREDVDGMSWSPDGAELALSLAGAGGLWLMSDDGSNLRKLGDGQDPVWAWSPRQGR